MGDEAAGCFSCCTEAEGDDCIEAISSGAIFTADEKRRRQSTWQSKLAAVFFVINYSLTLVDAVFGGISIHDTLQKFGESNNSIVATTGNNTIFSNTTGSFLLSSTTTHGNSLLANSTDLHGTSTYVSISPVLPEGTNSSTADYDDGRSGLNIWVYFYVVFCVIYLPFETLMVIYILFGFNWLICKCGQAKNNAGQVGRNYDGNVSQNSTAAETSSALKEIPIECMLLFESILLNMMSYGQLAFSQSSHTNSQIYIEGLNIVESPGALAATSVVTYLLTFGHLFKARNRLKVGYRGRKPWMKFLFRLLEFVMSGIAMTSALMVLTVLAGKRLYVYPRGLLYTIFIWSLFSHAACLLLLTEKGRAVLVGILECLSSGNKK